MDINTFGRTVGRLAAAAGLAAMALHSAPAFAGNVCSNADLQGAYVYSINATAINFPPNGPVSILGKITLDGRGNFAGTVNGEIAGAFDLTDNPSLEPIRSLLIALAAGQRTTSTPTGLLDSHCTGALCSSMTSMGVSMQNSWGPASAELPQVKIQ